MMKKLFYVGLMLLISNLTVSAQVQLTASDPSPICVGGSALLTASGASSYVWSPATGLSATTGATVKATPTVTTVYSVTGTTDGNSSTKTITVAVNPNCNAVCHNSGGGASFNWVGLTHYYTGDNTEEDLIGDADLFHLNNEGFAPGKINNGFSLNGNHQRFQSLNNTFCTSGDFTISLWFKANSFAGSSILLSTFNGVGTGNILRIAASRQVFFTLYPTASSFRLDGLTVFQPNTWYHVLLIREQGVRTTVYINNFLEAQLENADNVGYSPTTNLELGAYGGGENFNGVIDEVMFLNRKITEAERAALYNNGAGIQAPY